jgi:hypothetical protein
MPHSSRSITVGTTPTLLAEAKPRHRRSWLTAYVLLQAAVPVYYASGVPTVSVDDGTPLYAGDLLSMENSQIAAPAAAELWAVVPSGSVEVIVAEGA